MIVKLSKSSRPAKKYMVRIGNKTIHFGAAGYEDFTTHKDETRKEKYLARHRNEDWTNIHSAGFWARWLLWNKATLTESIRDVSKRSGVTFQRFSP